MSPATRSGFDYWLGRQNRSVLVTIRVTPQERAAIRAAAEWGPPGAPGASFTSTESWRTTNYLSLILRTVKAGVAVPDWLETPTKTG